MPKPLTYTFVQEPDSDLYVRHGLPPEGLSPLEAWPDPSTVPTPLRHTLQTAYHSGFDAEELALIYELPVTWVRLFVEEASGCA